MLSRKNTFLIEGSKYSDTLLGYEGEDILFGLRGDDKIFGNYGSDTLYGGKGKDKLFGEEGSDKLFGGKGKDKLFGGVDSDKLFGNKGKDELFGGESSDKLFGGKGKDELFGGEGSDKLFGGKGDDKLIGGEGSDKLFGQNGNDYLYGAEGINFLRGGRGKDTFALDSYFGLSFIRDFSINNDLIAIKNFEDSSLNFKMDQNDKDVEISIDERKIGIIENVSLRNLVYKNGFICGADDFSETIYTQGLLELNSSIKGNLERKGDRDWISIKLEKGKKYQFEMEGSSLKNDLTLIDSFLCLRGSQGDYITYDDDSGIGLNSKIIYTAKYNGIYFLDAGAYDDYNKGTYSLSFSTFENIKGWSNHDGWGSVNAAQAFENLLGFDLQERNDIGGDNWGLDFINIQDVWLGNGNFEGVTGEGVTVAILDTGIDYSHGEFEGRIVQGWDFVDNDSLPEDGNGHGTHVAGIIAGSNDGFGITGVAFDSNIMPIRVLNNQGWGTYSDISAGIRFAADNGADIANLSLGSGRFNQEINSAIRYASERGTVVVMSAGNSGASQPDYPALYATDFGIAVAAISENGTLASFSNLSGNNVMDYVSAPGVDIYSSIPGNNYSYFSGTSMAAPHVSGIAALLRSYDNQLNSNQIEQLISSSTQRYDENILLV